MSWRREWLLTNRTRVPGGTVSSLGVTIPPLEMVTTNGFEGLVGGVPGESPPHDTHAALRKNRTARPRGHGLGIGGILTGEPASGRTGEVNLASQSRSAWLMTIHFTGSRVLQFTGW